MPESTDVRGLAVCGGQTRSSSARSLRRFGALGTVLWLLAWLLPMTSVFAQEWTPLTGPPLRIGVFVASPQAPASTIVDSLPLTEYKPIDAMPLTLKGDGERHRWLRIDTELPVQSNMGDRWALRLDRAGVDQLTLYWPRATGLPPSATLDFYHPDGSPAELSNGYAFVLPRGLHGPVTLYLDVAAGADISLFPRLLPESTVIAEDRHGAILFTAIYTGLILLALTGIALFGILRDRVYLYYTAYAVALTLAALAQNGHLYWVPALAALQPLRSLGPSLLRCLLAASLLVLVRPLLGLVAAKTRIDTTLRWAPLVALAFAATCVIGLPVLERPLQIVSCVVLLAAVGLCALAAGVAMVQRRHLAAPLLLMWLLVLGTLLIRIAVPFGLVPSNDFTLYGAQVAGAFSAFLLSIAMADRIIEFRQQRDRARLAQVQADNNLRIEQERRKFVEALHMGLRRAAAGDQDWMAYRRLLDVVRLLIPQTGCAVAAYHPSGEELLVCHPEENRERYTALMAARGVAFRGICRSQLPIQLRIEQPASEDAEALDSQFAVLPLRLGLPAWGVLLIERAAGEVFAAEELQLAREFAEKAAGASEEAASSRALRRSAEFDALTGAFNRRAVDLYLDKAFMTARSRNSPLSALFVDLDRLKETNDLYGHAVGDRCLRLLAEALSARCGESGMFGRFGGDEFVVVLTGASPEHAKRWADELLAATKQLSVQCPEGIARLSVSIGVASRIHADNAAQEMLERADKALYAAKRLGRDRVQTFEGLHGLHLPEVSER